MDVYQYVGKNRQRQSRVYVWGYTYTGALGVKEFLIPKGFRSPPRPHQSAPYTLQVKDKVGIQLKYVQVITKDNLCLALNLHKCFRH